MKYSDLIKQERLRRGWSARELARQAKISVATISRIESGERLGHGHTVAAINTALGIDPSTAQAAIREEIEQPAPEMSIQELLERARVLVEREAAVTIMLVDQRAAAGYIGGYLSEGEAAVERLPYLPAPDERNHDLLAIRVSGSCLEPLIMDGHIAIVDRSVEAQPGKIVLAIHEGEALLKKFEMRDGRPYLASLNGQIAIPVNKDTRIAGVVKTGMYPVP